MESAQQNLPQGCRKGQVSVSFLPTWRKVILLHIFPPKSRHAMGVGGQGLSFYNALLITAEHFCRGIVKQKDLENKFSKNKKNQVVFSVALGRNRTLQGAETGFSEPTN